MFRKGKSAVKGDFKKSRRGIEAEGRVELQEVGTKISLVKTHQKVVFRFSRIKKKEKQRHSKEGSFTSGS